MNAIYARQSVDRADSISIESQIEFCQYEMRGEQYKVYTDRGYSGKNTDRPAFAEMMNQKAAELGCTNTHFTCPHGLYDHNNYSTARDMAKIALACHANGTYMQVANTVSYTLPATNLHPARNISSTNRLLKPGSAYYRGYAQGMKTGFTTQAGRCFVTFASQNGRTYGLVILGSNSQNIFREAAELFDWAFSNPDLQPKAAAPETKKHSLFSFWQNLLG